MTIQKADQETRKKAFILLGVITVIGAIVIQFGLPRLTGYMHSLPLNEAIQLFIIVTTLPFISIIPIAIYCYRIGRKVIASNQFPPPGSKVIRDTKVLTGLAARRRGLTLVALSSLMMVIGVFASAYFPIKINNAFNKPNTHKE